MNQIIPIQPIIFVNPYLVLFLVIITIVLVVVSCNLRMTRRIYEKLCSNLTIRPIWLYLNRLNQRSSKKGEENSKIDYTENGSGHDVN